MAYTTKMELGKKVELLNAGIIIHVKQNGSAFGKLEVSKGGIRWLKSPKYKRGANLGWTEFDRKLKL